MSPLTFSDSDDDFTSQPDIQVTPSSEKNVRIMTRQVDHHDDDCCFGLFGAEPGPGLAPPLVRASHTVSPALRSLPYPETKANVDSSTCCMCHVSEGKYCCPGCGRRTCSLSCCTRHKQQHQCTGSRDRIPFLRIPEFRDKHLVDDYFLLEEISDVVERSVRARKRICRSHSTSGRDIPNWLMKLRYEARMRGTRMKFSPSGSTRSLRNKSMFHYLDKVIFWTTEWVFASIAGSDFKITDNRISESELIGNLLAQKIRDLQEGSDGYPVLRKGHKIKAEQLLVLLRHEASHTFHVTDNSLTLQKALQGKAVIDFPTFVITYKSNMSKFPLFKDRDTGKAVEATEVTHSDSSSDDCSEADEKPVSQPAVSSVTLAKLDKEDKEDGECSSGEEES